MIGSRRFEEVVHDMADKLQELYDELTEQSSDRKKISNLLEKLSVQTSRTARRVNSNYQDSLEDLADSLKEFSKELK